MKQIKLKIITPERIVLEDIVDQVSLPTSLGEITILPDHIPLIASVASGDIVSCVNGEICFPMAVSGGFLEVKKNEEGITEVAVLADFAEHVSEISDQKIEQAKQKAEEMRIQMANKENVDFEHFAAELERSLTRVKIADKWRTRKYKK